MSWWVVIVAVHPASGRADPPTPAPVTVSLRAPEAVTIGDRFAVEIVVARSPEARDQPLILTPVADGSSVDVVRGRLLPEDAADPSAEPLRFRLPCVARSRGTSVLRVEVRTFVCPPGSDPGARCRAVQETARLTLRVDRPGPA